MTQLKEIINRFEAFAPKSMASEKDPVGLHFGHLDQEIQKIMVTLDVRPEVVEEAIREDVDLIFAHHPPIFRPIKRFDTSIPQNKMYADLIKHDIAVYAAHTNLDAVPGGMNDWLAEALGLNNTQVMVKNASQTFYTLVTFVPVEDAKSVRQALHQAGAGELGDYHEAAFTSTGLGHFTPKDGANPTIGQVNQAESVQETRIELIFQEKDRSKVITNLLEAHPYEEPAYHIFENKALASQDGYGRVGDLEKAMTYRDFIAYCKEIFQVEGLRYIGHDLDSKVQRIAVMGGDGGGFFQDALKAGADVFVTGDIYYHVAHDMEAAGLKAVDPGHHIESICKKHLKDLFEGWQAEENWQLEVMASTINTDPFHYA